MLSASSLSDIGIVFLTFLNVSLTGAEAIGAIDRLVALRLERYASGRSTFGTGYFGSATRVIAIALHAHQDSTVGTSLRFIHQTLSAEELLLSSREDKSLVAVPTINVLVLENHSVPPVI
jgi:hypothetical protein